MNFMPGDEGDRVESAYGGANYPRLAAAKQRYDPANLFSMNANIKPVKKLDPVRGGSDCGFRTLSLSRPRTI